MMLSNDDLSRWLLTPEAIVTGRPTPIPQNDQSVDYEDSVDDNRNSIPCLMGKWPYYLKTTSTTATTYGSNKVDSCSTDTTTPTTTDSIVNAHIDYLMLLTSKEDNDCKVDVLISLLVKLCLRTARPPIERSIDTNPNALPVLNRI